MRRDSGVWESGGDSQPGRRKDLDTAEKLRGKDTEKLKGKTFHNQFFYGIVEYEFGIEIGMDIK